LVAAALEPGFILYGVTRAYIVSSSLMRVNWQTSIPTAWWQGK
jgi:hypothetical protein